MQRQFKIIKNMEQKKESIYDVFFASEGNKKYFSSLSCNRKMLSAFTEVLGWLDVWSDDFRTCLYTRSEYAGDAFTIRFRFSLSAKDSDGYNGVISYLHNVASALRRFNSDLRSEVSISPVKEHYPASFQMVDVEFKCWFDLPF